MIIIFQLARNLHINIGQGGMVERKNGIKQSLKNNCKCLQKIKWKGMQHGTFNDN